MIVLTSAMLILLFPVWFYVFSGIAAFICSAAAVTLIKFAVKIISEKDRQIKTASFTFKMLAADAKHLMTDTKTKELKSLTKKVYESIRYSDVMSNYALKEINERIQRQFSAFEDAVRTEDLELSNEIASELLSIIDERNKKCRLLK